MEDNNNKGYFYVLYNEMFNYYGKNVFKLGKTNDINIRLKGYTTSYIEPCEIKYLSTEVKNYNLLEKLIFKHFKQNRIKPNREFFKIDNLKLVSEYVEKEIERINNLTENDILLEIIKLNKEAMNKYKYTTSKPKNEINETIKKELNLDTDIKQINYLNTIDYFNLNLDNYKIKLIREFEENNKIKQLDINFNNSKPEINITDDELKLIKKVFRITKSKPVNVKELNKFYIGMIRNITGCLDIVKSENTKDKNNKSITFYNFDKELIKTIVRLNNNIQIQFLVFE
jgi:hypothetical protein